jgi:cytoskeletal protein CcmA (bactofilin family)
MATPFFGKRENETPTNLRHGAAGAYGSGSSGGTLQSPPSSGTSSSAARPVSDTVPTAATTHEGGSKLTVGPNIKLKGVEITDCDTLVVEGTVEATMDSRLMQIAEQGAFNGSAEIDIAEIHGSFDGNLTVRQKLVIFATGKVTGKIRYGKIVIEEGGQLSGEIQFGTTSTSGAARPMVNKPALQAIG